MASFQFVGNRGGDGIEIELTAFFGDARDEHHLEQQIAELVADRRGLARSDRLGQFVGFLQRVRHDARHRLGAVPRAAALRITQPTHHVEQSLQRLAHAANSSPRSRR